MPHIRILEFQIPVCSAQSKLFLWASPILLLECTSPPTMLVVHFGRLHVFLSALLALKNITNVLVLLFAKKPHLHLTDAIFSRRSYLFGCKAFCFIQRLFLPLHAPVKSTDDADSVATSLERRLQPVSFESNNGTCCVAVRTRDVNWLVG
jgi:hypothetical protein